jgi:hypothetical protein
MVMGREYAAGVEPTTLKKLYRSGKAVIAAKA